MLFTKKSRNFLFSICTVLLATSIVKADGEAICSGCNEERVNYMCQQVLPYCPAFPNAAGQLLADTQSDFARWYRKNHRCQVRSRQTYDRCIARVQESRASADRKQERQEQCRSRKRARDLQCSRDRLSSVNKWARDVAEMAVNLLGECPTSPACLAQEAASSCQQIEQGLTTLYQKINCLTCRGGAVWASVRGLAHMMQELTKERCQKIDQEMTKCQAEGWTCAGKPDDNDPDECKDDDKLMSLMITSLSLNTDIDEDEYVEALGEACCDDECELPDPTPEPTPSNTPYPTPTYFPTPTPQSTPTPSPTPTPVYDPSTPTPSPTPTGDTDETPTPTPRVTPTPTPQATPTPQNTPDPTNTPTPMPTVYLPPTAMPTFWPEPTPKPTEEPTHTPTATVTPEPTWTPEPTVTHTPQPTQTPTAEPTATFTPGPTMTSTPEPRVTPYPY